MTQLHEPGEAWHIGWDWHADMWYVEPPFDVEFEDGEPMKWFHDRAEAFEEVDRFIREQPVQASIVDEIEQKFEPTVLRHEDNPLLQGDNKIPPALAKAQAAQRHSKPAEPVEPRRVYANDSARDRVADYADRVGLG